MSATSKATVDHVDPYLNGGTFGGRSIAEFSGEYVFDGPERYVSIQLNLDLEGRMSLSPGVIGITDGATLQVDAIVNSQRERATVALTQVGSTEETRFARTGDSFTLDPDAAWESLAGPDGAHLDLLTGVFTVPTGKAISIGLYLKTSYSIRGAGAAELDFASGLSFNRDGPVFILPADYTVTGNGIVDNLWVGALPPVPEPATTLLSALGLGVVSWRVRRRRAISSARPRTNAGRGEAPS